MKIVNAIVTVMMTLVSLVFFVIVFVTVGTFQLILSLFS
jgi:hypothetical protein